MINEKTVTAIILVAGNSTRFGKNSNKNFEKIDEKTVLYYSMKMFDKNNYIDNIIIAAKKSEISKVEEIVNRENTIKNTKVVCGGNTRKESVYNCIKDINSDYVIIHDGARPLIREKYINKCLEAMNDYKGVTVGVKSKDTIKITDENNIVVNTTKRANTWLIQTPQCFDRNVLLKMHNKYEGENITDDCSLLEMDNYKIKIIDGDYTNIKITTYEDLGIAREFIRNSII